MFFKNVFIFTLTHGFNFTAEQLQDRLAENTFTNCAATEFSRIGWTEALGEKNSTLVHSTKNNLLFCARKEQKILPTSVINDMLNEKVDEKESNSNFTVTNKEKQQLKEDITFELLPKAFSKLTDTHAYIDFENNIIAINASSRNRAEELLALLRKTLGSLPVSSLLPDINAEDTMTAWLTECELPARFEAGTEAEFRGLGLDANSTIKIKNQDLLNDDIKSILNDEKTVTKIGLVWNDSLSFVLNEDLSIKRLKFFGLTEERYDDIDSDSISERQIVDFELMSGELNLFIKDLFSVFNLCVA